MKNKKEVLKAKPDNIYKEKEYYIRRTNAIPKDP
jgi:hypothetical protein